MEWSAAWNGTPAMDLAREEATLSRVTDTGRPRLLAYGWDRPVLVLGYGQDSSEVNLAACQARGVAVVRRCTGGAGVLYQGDLALSLVLPETYPWARSIASLYEAFVEALQDGLEALGVMTTRSQTPRRGGPRSAICFEDHRAETLLLGGKKVLGCAQARRRGAVLIHGALLLGVDAELQSEVYGVTPERIEALLGTLPQEAYATRETLAKHLAQYLAGALGERVHPARPSAALPQELARRLHDPKWVIMRSEEWEVRSQE